MRGNFVENNLPGIYGNALGDFMESCLENLFPPGICGVVCNAESVDCFKLDFEDRMASLIAPDGHANIKYTGTTCPWTNDGFCDDLSSFCDARDTEDCSAGLGADSCRYAGDGVCDEGKILPRLFKFCAAGTDTTDCSQSDYSCGPQAGAGPDASVTCELRGFGGAHFEKNWDLGAVEGESFQVVPETLCQRFTREQPHFWRAQFEALREFCGALLDESGWTREKVSTQICDAMTSQYHGGGTSRSPEEPDSSTYSWGGACLIAQPGSTCSEILEEPCTPELCAEYELGWYALGCTDPSATNAADCESMNQQWDDHVCEYGGDGECDEPEYCALGSDTADCEASEGLDAPAPEMQAVAASYLIPVPLTSTVGGRSAAPTQLPTWC